MVADSRINGLEKRIVSYLYNINFKAFARIVGLYQGNLMQNKLKYAFALKHVMNHLLKNNASSDSE